MVVFSCVSSKEAFKQMLNHVASSSSLARRGRQNFTAARRTPPVGRLSCKPLPRYSACIVRVCILDSAAALPAQSCLRWWAAWRKTTVSALIHLSHMRGRGQLSAYLYCAIRDSAIPASRKFKSGTIIGCRRPFAVGLSCMAAAHGD